MAFSLTNPETMEVVCKESKKRARPSDSPITETISNYTPSNDETYFPKFLTISSKDAALSFHKFTPFAIGKAIEGAIGTAKTVQVLRSGQILIEVNRKAQADNLLRLKTLIDIPVSTAPHKTLNQCRGVIHSAKLAALDKNELLDGLKAQNNTITDVYILKPKNPDLAARTIFVTFNGTTVPTDIKAGYMNIKVQQYIPNPLRCRKCQKYGHSEKFCRSEAKCEKCGMQHENYEHCSREVKCCNCSGIHPASSNTCPKWKEEKEICRIKHTMNLSFPEARKTYQTRNPSTTYTAAAGNLQTSSTISQTVPTGISQVQPPTSKSMREVEVQTIYTFSYPTTYTVFKQDKIIWCRDK